MGVVTCHLHSCTSLILIPILHFDPMSQASRSSKHRTLDFPFIPSLLHCSVISLSRLSPPLPVTWLSDWRLPFVLMAFTKVRRCLDELPLHVLPALGAGGAAQRVLQAQATIALTSLSLTLTFFILSSSCSPHDSFFWFLSFRSLCLLPPWPAA